MESCSASRRRWAGSLGDDMGEGRKDASHCDIDVQLSSVPESSAVAAADRRAILIPQMLSFGVVTTRREHLGIENGGVIGGGNGGGNGGGTFRPDRRAHQSNC
ncbi:hypothetical protein K438DRAFT_1780768 [Mycena galopus ATCC 62051]|nr:hypothetical protein K438DRAFT_1780768 [Mycena galopus ATCC 62051]